MRKLSKLFSMVLTFAVVATSFVGLSSQANAAETKAYSYTVKLHIGGNGDEGAKFNGSTNGIEVSSNRLEPKVEVSSDTVTISNLSYNAKVSVTNPAGLVTVAPKSDETAYYVKGIRQAGADSKVSTLSFDVTKDVDYVIAYGVGATIPYTVKYQDGNGNALLQEETFYAKAGEELYVSYKYVDGYLPDAYNKHVNSLTEGTTITFTYNKGSHSVNGGTVNDGTSYSYAYVNGQTTTTYDYVQGEATTTGGTTVTGGNTSTGNGGNAGGADADAQEDDAQAEDETTIDDTESPTDGPVDIEEIGDTETPTHGGTESGITPATIAVVLAIIAVIALILIFFVLKARRKKAGTK